MEKQTQEQQEEQLSVIDTQYKDIKRCPNCSWVLSKIMTTFSVYTNKAFTVTTHFCPNCGQKLEWDKTEN